MPGPFLQACYGLLIEDGQPTRKPPPACAACTYKMRPRAGAHRAQSGGAGRAVVSAAEGWQLSRWGQGDQSAPRRQPSLTRPDPFPPRRPQPGIPCAGNPPSQAARHSNLPQVQGRWHEVAPRPGAKGTEKSLCRQGVTEGVAPLLLSCPTGYAVHVLVPDCIALPSQAREPHTEDACRRAEKPAKPASQSAPDRVHPSPTDADRVRKQPSFSGQGTHSRP